MLMPFLFSPETLRISTLAQVKCAARSLQCRPVRDSPLSGIGIAAYNRFAVAGAEHPPPPRHFFVLLENQQFTDSASPSGRWAR